MGGRGAGSQRLLSEETKYWVRTVVDREETKYWVGTVADSEETKYWGKNSVRQ